MERFFEVYREGEFVGEYRDRGTAHIAIRRNPGEYAEIRAFTRRRSGELFPDYSVMFRRNADGQMEQEE